MREEKREAKEVHYETLFDDYEGWSYFIIFEDWYYNLILLMCLSVY